MDMFDFMFPEQAEAKHLRSISRQMRSSNAVTRSAVRQTDQTVKKLEEDVRFLSMVIMSILKRLSENDTMSLGDMSDIFAEIDRLDGNVDGGLDPNVLRGLLGAVRAADQETEQPENAMPVIKVKRNRIR